MIELTYCVEWKEPNSIKFQNWTPSPWVGEHHEIERAKIHALTLEKFLKKRDGTDILVRVIEKKTLTASIRRTVIENILEFKE